MTADGTERDHIYVVELPFGRRWTTDYEHAFELAHGQQIDAPVLDEAANEDRISIMHKRGRDYVLDLSAEEIVRERQECCLNTRYDCGHVAYGPPLRLPPDCPECTEGAEVSIP